MGVCVVLVFGVWLTGLSSPSEAFAGTFTAFTCHDSTGAAVSAGEWKEATLGGNYITRQEGCANGGAGSFGLTMGPNPVENYNRENGKTLTYEVPGSLTILAYSLDLHAIGTQCVEQESGPGMRQCTSGFGEVIVNHTGQSDPTYDYRNLGNGEVNRTVGASELRGVSDVKVGVFCDPGYEPNYICPGSWNPTATAQISGGSFTILDPTVPTVSNVTGSLIAGGALSGTDSIDFTAADSGGGVYSATLQIDGATIVNETPNTNGGACVDLASAGEPAMAFASPQPCPAEENVSLSVDTAKLAPGAHHLRVTIMDAAGEEAVAYDGTITVAGTSTPAGTAPSTSSESSTNTSTSSTPGTTGAQTSATSTALSVPSPGPGAPNGANASDQAVLTAHWIRAAHAALTRASTTLTGGYGTNERVEGRLTTTSGQPIAGATIDASETPTYAGAHAQTLPSPHTGPNGEWSIALPRGTPSSSLRFGYRSHLNDTTPAATATLTLRVHAGIALGIAPRVTRVGRRIHFTGIVHGPIPPGGKQLVLEASSGGEWIQFDTVHTNAQGRYHASYRFKFPGPVTYRFRVVSPFEADFPFLAGISDDVAVREL